MGLAAAKLTARRWIEPVLTVVFPSSCPSCRRLLSRPSRGPLCEVCWEALPRHEGPRCRCGVPLPPGQPVCGRCRRGRQPLAAGASLGPYEGALRVAIHQLKYRGRRRIAARLVEKLLESAAAHAVIDGCDVLVPVPLHPRRLRERGFNQATLLARELGRRVDRPCAERVLTRHRDTEPQAGLSAAARRRNVRDAFAVRRRGRVDGRVVALVDDVVTTGATVTACALALRGAGAREVRLLSVARVL